VRGEAETTELAERAKSLEDLLYGLPIDKPTAAPGHPDGFQYEITFPDAGGQSRSVVLDEAEISDELRPLIQLAMQRGTLA
jgi:hypothetical protein